MLNVNIAFVLHLYQPVTQERGFFNEIYSSCYSPLLKLIKNKKDLRVTLNTPLSLLQQMEEYGHTDWIDLLKELVSTEKVEITGSAAYHPLLTKIPQEIAEEEIILNEYGLGYYLGRRNGFEGEPSILIKDLYGFFPPELAVSKDLIEILSSLGYCWVIADELSVHHGGGIYEIPDIGIKMVVRNRDLSNIISFKRDSDTRDFQDMLNTDKIVVLDGETFGHHNSEGLLLFENIIDYIHHIGGNVVNVSSYIDKTDEYIPLDSKEAVKESSWGASDEEAIEGNIYPMWDNKGNKLHAALWKLQKEIVEAYGDNFCVDVEDCENIPVWKNFPDEDYHARILFLQSLNSDQFWWASRKTMPDGNVLFDVNMVRKSLNIYKELLKLKPLASSDRIEKEIEKVEDLFTNFENKLY